MDSTLRYNYARFVALLGAGKNLLLAALKIIFGVLGHSHALIADGIHSLADLFTDTLVLIASRFGSQAADHNHPYGHGRIETASTMLLALILMVTGVGIIVNAGGELWGAREITMPATYVFVVAAFSMLVNEILYFVTKRYGEKINSKLLTANAWHHRSDSLSSFVVLLGLLGAWLGYGKLDAVAAAVVGVMIIHMGWKFAWQSVCELVDMALDDEIVEEIKQHIVEVPGVAALHQLRTRLFGGMIILDVHILVKPTISVSEGHFIGEQVHFNLMKKMPHVRDVTVHVDPEDDEIMAPSVNLPSRQEILQQLTQRWQNLLDKEAIQNIRLHYLNGRLFIEVCLPLKNHPEQHAQQLKQQLTQSLADLPFVAEVKVLIEC